MLNAPRLIAAAAGLSVALAAGLALARADGALSNPWSKVAGPSTGRAEAIGSTARGCLTGAVQLPFDGPGFEVIHLGRKRYFGHPDTVAFVERLGKRGQAASLPPFMVGDMAQPRGGPLPFGHASHQTGIDVDIWFDLEAKPALALAAREDVALPSMLLPTWRAINPKRFGRAQITLLRLAASDPRVDRIFVNPVIKAALCRGMAGGDRAWLQRLRPWWGHDDHFHVRLSCPAGSPDCEPQAAIPPGDGCDSILASWVRHQQAPPPQPPPAAPRPLPTLPAACHALLPAP
jgi:penicillin-insensitive murein DD-endopeptidase